MPSVSEKQHRASFPHACGGLARMNFYISESRRQTVNQWIATRQKAAKIFPIECRVCVGPDFYWVGLEESNCLIFMAPREGFEPPTRWLTAT